MQGNTGCVHASEPHRHSEAILHFRQISAKGAASKGHSSNYRDSNNGCTSFTLFFSPNMVSDTQHHLPCPLKHHMHEGCLVQLTACRQPLPPALQCRCLPRQHTWQGDMVPHSGPLHGTCCRSELCHLGELAGGLSSNHCAVLTGPHVHMVNPLACPRRTHIKLC